MAFSCANCREIIEYLIKYKPKNIILSGIETHVCILQSALDLIETGVKVFVPIDGTGSRKRLDHKTAINRMEYSGAIITSTESVIFELCKTSDRAEFKPLSLIIKSKDPPSIKFNE